MQDEHHDSLFWRHRHSNHNGNNKGEYGLVPLVSTTTATSAVNDGPMTTRDENGRAKDTESDLEEDDVNDDFGIERDHAIMSSKPVPPTGGEGPAEGWNRILFTPLLPDNRFLVLGTPLLEGIKAVRLVKFFAVTWMGLFGMFYFVRLMVRPFCTNAGLQHRLLRNFAFTFGFFF